MLQGLLMVRLPILDCGYQQFAHPVLLSYDEKGGLIQMGFEGEVGNRNDR